MKTTAILTLGLTLTLTTGCSAVPLRSKEFFDEAQVARIQDEIPCQSVQARDTSVLFLGMGGTPSVQEAIRQLPSGARNVETTERITSFVLLPFFSFHTATAEACVRRQRSSAGESESDGFSYQRERLREKQERRTTRGGSNR